jgi:hypothetical protein
MDIDAVTVETGLHLNCITEGFNSKRAIINGTVMFEDHNGMKEEQFVDGRVIEEEAK